LGLTYLFLLTKGTTVFPIALRASGSSVTICVRQSICKADRKHLRSSLLLFFPMLPSPAQPCSPDGWSGIGFHGHLSLILPAWPRRQSHCSQVVWCQHLQWGQESAKQWKSFGLRTRVILWIFWSKTGSILGLTYLFLEERNSSCSYCPQGLGIICYHLCWAVHLQGRWETPEKQPPAAFPHAALPCTALLTGWLVWNWFPWPFESHSASMAA